MSSARIPVRGAAKAWLKDPSFRTEYDALEPELALAPAPQPGRDDTRRRRPWR